MKVDTDGLANAVDEIREELVPYEDRVDHRKGILWTASECLRQIKDLEKALAEKPLTLDEVFGPPDVEALVADNQRLREEVEELRKRDAERKAVIDDALCEEIEKLKDLQRAKERTVEGLKKEIERLEKANKDMAGCHCLQCTDMQCEGPARAIIHPEESDT